MKSFKMRARTLDRKHWYEFTIADIPMHFTPEEFLIFSKPGSPRLLLDTIVRGADMYNLFEGDIVLDGNEEYLICYERGFYAISHNYVIKHLDQLHDPIVIGSCDTMSFPVSIMEKKRHLFKYKDTIFRMQDIVYGEDGKLVISSIPRLIDPQDIQQECCMSYNKKKLFLGDCYKDSPVFLYKGRICANTPQGTIDCATGGIINGRTTQDTVGC